MAQDSDSLCAKCGQVLAPDQQFCGKCGVPRGRSAPITVRPHGALRQSATPIPPRKPGIRSWIWHHKKTSALFVVLVALILDAVLVQIFDPNAGTAQAPTPSPTPSPTHVAQVVPTTHANQPTPTPKHKKRKPNIAAKPTKVPKPTAINTPVSTSTPQPTSTPRPPATKPPKPTATPDGRIQERADFRDFYGHLSGAENLCTDATTIAQNAVTVSASDPSQTLAAYTAATDAHDACDNAANVIATFSAPDSVPAFKYQEILNASFARMGAIRDEWFNLAKVLNAGTADLATQAAVQQHIKDAQTDADVEEADLAVIIYTLDIKLKNIPAITPNL